MPTVPDPDGGTDVRSPAIAAADPGAVDEIIRRRRLRFATLAAVASALVAVGVTGVGLLLPGGESTPVLRLVAVAVALVAGGVLVRLDGPARASTMLALVGAVGAIVCLLTFPASPVSLRIGPDTLPFTPPGAIEDGPTSGAGDQVVIGPGVPGVGVPGAMRLPDGFDVVVRDGLVIAIGPDGATTVLGSIIIDGGFGGLGRAGSDFAVGADGSVTRQDGGVLGPDVSLGGVTLERGDGTQVVVGAQGTLDVPEPIETETPDPTEGLDALLALLLAAFAMLAFAPPIMRFGERIAVTLVDPVDDDVDPPVDSSSTVSMEDELSDVLAAMLADPDPRTSVIGAYARLLDALAATGFPRHAQEGPHEHLWRILGPLGVRRQPVHQLAELFVRARFTPRPVTADHRQAAITALADAIADLRLRDDAIDDGDIRRLVAQVEAS